MKEDVKIQETKQVKSRESSIPGVDGKNGEKIELKGVAEGGSFKIVNCGNCSIDLLELT